MNTYRYPGPDELRKIVTRPSRDAAEIRSAAADILCAVREAGDEAVRELTRRFDGYAGQDLKVGSEEIRRAADDVPEELRAAIGIAAENIGRFHAAQESGVFEVETFPGVVCGRRPVAIEKVGIYVPGGTAPLFSTVLMLAIPAGLAGCDEIVICTPPAQDGSVHPAVLYAAAVCGATAIYRIGGAQAVAAMAYGTETVPRVDKIFGPGNRFVTEAKMLAAAEGMAIDIPAGPSEVAVIADATCDPVFVAADLLSQAEHGEDSQVLLVTDSEEILSAVRMEIEKQLAALPREEIARAALGESSLVLVSDAEAAAALANEYAPEHLVIASDRAEEIAEGISNAGSVFLGHFACESAGDYASGTNHTLPTAGFARSYSGVSLDSFRKYITYQRISEEGIRGLGPVIETMAEAEGLRAHRNAVSVRLDKIGKAAVSEVESDGN